MSKKKDTKPEEPAPGFNNLVNNLLNTPPAPKEGKKNVRRKDKSNK